MRRVDIAIGSVIVALLLACGPHEEAPVVGAPVAPPASVDVPPPGPSQAPVATDEPPPKKGDKPRVEETPFSRDGRRSTIMPRKVSLLTVELQGITNLLQATAMTSPDRPLLLRRIAEDYVELEYSAHLDGSNDVMANARHEAIIHYTSLAQDYPNYAQRDEVLYYLAYEHEVSGDLAAARKGYYELISKNPNSKYIPNAYLAFGEMFFAEAGKGDPSKYDLAEQAYNEVLKYPPPSNNVWGYANYMLAQVALAKGDNVKAIASLKKTIDYARTYPQLPNAQRLGDVARKDMVFAYAQAGDPRKAFNFFQTLTNDGSGDQSRTFDMMAHLGETYMTTAHYAEASALYQDLRARDATHQCKWAAQVSNADNALHGTPQSPATLQSALAACGP